MKFDTIIEKYGTHELLVIPYAEDAQRERLIFCSCHKHDYENDIIFPYYFKIKGKIQVLAVENQEKMGNGDSYDIFDFRKNEQDVYEMNYLGGWMKFRAEGDFDVEELEEDAFCAQVSENQKALNKQAHPYDGV